uniref:Uncharacterized protein n=1 Tax=Ceratitis capitata TaxID=7213 RepID=W8BWZ8_CERCA
MYTSSSYTLFLASQLCMFVLILGPSHHITSTTAALGQRLGKFQKKNYTIEDEIYSFSSIFLFFSISVAAAAAAAAPVLICCCPYFSGCRVGDFLGCVCDPRKSPEGHTATFGAS